MPFGESVIGGAVITVSIDDSQLSPQLQRIRSKIEQSVTGMASAFDRIGGSMSRAFKLEDATAQLGRFSRTIENMTFGVDKAFSTVQKSAKNLGLPIENLETNYRLFQKTQSDVFTEMNRKREDWARRAAQIRSDESIYPTSTKSRGDKQTLIDEQMAYYEKANNTMRSAQAEFGRSASQTVSNMRAWRDQIAKEHESIATTTQRAYAQKAQQESAELARTKKYGSEILSAEKQREQQMMEALKPSDQSAKLFAQREAASAAYYDPGDKASQMNMGFKAMLAEKNAILKDSIQQEQLAYKQNSSFLKDHAATQSSILLAQATKEKQIRKTFEAREDEFAYDPAKVAAQKEMAFNQIANAQIKASNASVAAEREAYKENSLFLNKRQSLQSEIINSQIAEEKRLTSAINAELRKRRQDDTQQALAKQRVNRQAQNALQSDVDKQNKQNTANTQKAIQQAQKDAEAAARGTGSYMQTVLGRIERTMMAFATVYGIQKIAQGLHAMTAIGVEFSSQLEMSRLGIASVIAAQAEFTSQSGKALEGTDKLNAALGVSDEIIRKLRIDNLMTTATFEQLVKAFREAVAPGMQVGLNLDQIRQFTVGMTQAAGAMGLPLDMLAEETRSMLRGTIQPRQTLIATALGIRPDDIKRFKYDAEGLFSFIMKKLETFKYAGFNMQKTFTGMATNLKDIFAYMMGTASKDFFEKFKFKMGDFMGSLADVNMKTGTVGFNVKLMIQLRQFYELVGNVTDVIENLIRGLMRLELNTKSGNIAQVFGVMGTSIRDVAEDIAAITRAIEALFGIVSFGMKGYGSRVMEIGLVAMIILGVAKIPAIGPYLAGLIALGEIIREIMDWMDELEKKKANVKPIPTSQQFFGDTLSKDFAEIGIKEQSKSAITNLESSDAGITQLANVVSNEATPAFNQFNSSLIATANNSQTADGWLQYLNATVNQSAMVARKASWSWDDLAKSIKETQGINIKKWMPEEGIQAQIDDLEYANKLKAMGMKGPTVSAYGKARETTGAYDAAIAEADKQLTAGYQLDEGAWKKYNQAHQDKWLIQRRLQLELEGIALDKKNTKGGGGGSTKGPVELLDIDQDIARFRRGIEDLLNRSKDLFDDYYASLAEYSGDYYTGERIRMERWLRDQTYAMDRDIEQADQRYKEMLDKIEKNKVGATAEVQARMAQEAIWLKGQKEVIEERKSQLPMIAEFNMQKAILEKTQARTIAIMELDKAYIDLTGSIEDQLRAEIALIKAKAEQDVVGKDPIYAEAIRRKALAEAYGKQIELSGSFGEGFIYAAQEAGREIETSGQMGIRIFESFKSAIDGAADALTEFTMTGKMNFTNFAESMIRDIMRIMYQAALMKMVTGIVGLFSSGNTAQLASIDTTIASMQSTNLAANAPAFSMQPTMHSGGIAGITSGTMRSLPRFHSGLSSDEYPAILQRGETILPKGYGNKQNKSGPEVQVIINNKTGQNVKHRETEPRFDGKRWVKEVVLELQQTDPTFRSAMGR